MYLYAGIHTVILLLIYLPAKFRFQQIHALLFPPPQDAATTNNGTPQPDTTNIWLDLLKDPFDKFKGVLIAASPFLASIIQSLFGLLFQH